MGNRANYLSATGGVLLLEPDPIVNFQLTAHSLNPGTHNFEHSNYFGHPRGNFLARLIFSTWPSVIHLEQKHNTFFGIDALIQKCYSGGVKEAL